METETETEVETETETEVETETETEVETETETEVETETETEVETETETEVETETETEVETETETETEAETETQTGGGGNDVPESPTVQPNPGTIVNSETLLASSTEAFGKNAPNSAKLEVSTNSNGKRSAHFNLILEGIIHAYNQAENRDTIYIDASNQRELNAVQVTADGTVFTRLSDKEAYLAIRTGILSIEVPTVSFKIDEFAKRNQLNGSVRVDLAIQEVSANELGVAVHWASENGAKLIGSPFQTSIQLHGDRVSEYMTGFGNRFAKFTIPVPETVKDPSRLAAVLLRDGKVVPVPMSINDNGQAVIHTTESATIMLIERQLFFEHDPHHWASEVMQSMAFKGLIPAEDLLVQLGQDQVTRAQFATLIVDALGLGYRAPDHYPYIDLTGNAETDRIIHIVTESGLFKGVAEDRFSPDTTISREQMISVVMRAVNSFALDLADQPSANHPFIDREAVSAWAQEALQAAQDKGLIAGYSDGSIGPDKPVTLNEAAYIIRNLLVKSGLTRD